MSFVRTVDRGLKGHAIVCSTAAEDAVPHSRFMARCDREGIWLWCRYCRAEHRWGWPDVLTFLLLLLGEGDLQRLLKAAVASGP